ncbi:hypothetical protein Tco_0072199 [Tanacetum coccineum]
MLGEEHEAVSMGNTGVVGVVVTRVIGQVVVTTLNPPIGNTGDAAVKEHEVVSMGNTSDESTADKGVIGSNVATTLNPPFCDNLVMVVPNLKGTRYTKEPICVEYKWEPLRCSTCLIFGHSLEDCPKAPKRVVNMMDKGEGGSYRANDEGFIKEGKCVFVIDDGKPLEKVDYSGNQGSEDEVEYNEMTSYLASKLLGLDMGLRACWNNEGKHM